MRYEGPLYGKIGRGYIQLIQTSKEVDQMEKELVKVKAMLTDAMKWVYACRCENQNRKEMIQRWEEYSSLPYTEEELNNALQERMNDQFVKGPDK